MRETRADTQRALLQALGLHVVLFALMFAGLQWTRAPSMEAAGEPIEAELADPSALSRSMQRALRNDAEPLPEPVPEPEPVETPLPEPVAEEPPVPAELPPPVPDPAPVEQERVQRAPAPKVADVPREQEERRKRPEQADLDAQREQDQRREKMLAEIRRQREQATRERTQAEMRAEQLADARSAAPTPPKGNPNSDSNRSAYGVAIQIAVERQWQRPDSIQRGQICQVTIVQIPGGEVVEVQVSRHCPYDALGRRSLEAAILRASPLPYAGFEDVFERRLTLNFQPGD